MGSLRICGLESRGLVSHVIVAFHGSECTGCHLLECETVLVDRCQISFVLKVEEVDFSKILIPN